MSFSNAYQTCSAFDNIPLLSGTLQGSELSHYFKLCLSVYSKTNDGCPM
jgi:hypothetical protein